METKNQNQKWTEVAEKSHNERFSALAQKLQSQIMKISAKFHFNEFVNYSIAKIASEERMHPAAKFLSFIESFNNFYTVEELSHIYEIFPKEYIQMMDTSFELKQCVNDIVIIHNSILTIENLIRIPIYCN